MHIFDEKLRAPELKVTRWLTNHPLTLADLRRKVVLIDFWDYTCINCLHTLPYLKAWHDRYHHAGLVIIGLHAPEFQFAHEYQPVEAAIKRFAIPYPVALDNQFQTWNAFANRAWPAKYLIDAQGYLRAFHRGEGAYIDFERAIQTLLLEVDANQQFPDPLAPLHDFDQTGKLCLRPTPELYCGWGRSAFGNGSARLEDNVQQYQLPAEQEVHRLYPEGSWKQTKESLETTELVSKLHLQYQARQVNIVLEPSVQPATVRILLNGQPVPAESRGADIQVRGTDTILSITEPKMFELITHSGFEQHELILESETPGLKIYAFTFVGCPAST